METTNQTEVLELNQAFYRAFEKRDINSMAKLWFQGAGSLCIHPGGKVLKGWNEVRLSWEQIFSHTDYIEIEIEIVTKEIGERVAYRTHLGSFLVRSRRDKFDRDGINSIATG